MTRWRALRPAGALLALALVSGCHFQKPKYDISDRTILLVPFRDLSVRYGKGYGESPRGKRVIESMRGYLERNFSPRFTDAAATEAVVRELREWTKEGITARDWRNLLAGIGADVVVVGEIRELQTRDPRTIGIFKGTVRGGYTVIDAATGRPLYTSSDLKLIYPPEKKITMPLSEFGAEEADIERGLLRLLGERVGKDLFGSYGEEE